jgi:2',3'-cyclic-nucleotide 2'-phosphodiesterase (5'-nucleotidase family)
MFRSTAIKRSRVSYQMPLLRLFSMLLIFSLILMPGHPAQALETPAYTLQILHYYGESGLLGVETAPIMGALIDKFDDQYSNTLVLGEGDSYIPGPWLVGGADPSLNAVPGIGATALGRPDIAIMNAFGTDASALGNHEFDLGSPVLQTAIQGAGPWVGAQFPLITANLDFSADSFLRGLADKTLNNNFNANNFAGQEASSIKAKIAPYAVVTQGGEKIGLVGATTYELLIKSSPNGTLPKDDGNPATDDLQEVAGYLQAAVNSLTAMGVNKIVMVDQLDTIERNKLLAPMVSGIDIMVAGGGHERMGDATDTAVGFNGHTADFISDAYPVVKTGLDGKPVLIVTTDTEYTYLGRLVADFNAAGDLIVDNLDPAINGAYASTETNLQAAYGTTDNASQIIASSTIGSSVYAIVDAINKVIAAKDGELWGYTNVYLEGDRAFGRVQEVNLGDISADANSYAALQALGAGNMTSLKNGGGLRASIGSIDEDGNKIAPIANPIANKPAGAISTLDIENALRFDNKLMVFDTTPQGLKNILEFAAGLSSGPTVQSGGYMQIGGMHVSYNFSSGAPNRVKSISLTDLNGNITTAIYRNGVFYPGAPAVIRMVCLNFTANGGDGYPIKPNADNFRYLLTDGTVSAPVDEALDFTAGTTFASVGQTAGTILGEQKAFKDYLSASHSTPEEAYNQADTPIPADERIQILPIRTVDTVIPSPTVSAGGPYSVIEGSTVTLNATGSDINGNSLTYAWDLDNNGSFETPGQNVAFSAPLTAPSTYTVKVQGTDVGGLTTVSQTTIAVLYKFAGFFSPLSNPPAVNSVNSGQTVPIKFSLTGNQGLNIFAAGFTKIQFVSCTTGDTQGSPVSTKNSGSLTYDPILDRYSYGWKTEKGWAGSCGVLKVMFNDGTTQTALFRFVK